MSYMRGTMLVDETALLTNTNPACKGLANVPLADNWVDDLRAGWHDAIVGSYAVEAVRMFADVKTWLGDSAGAAEYYALHARIVLAFNSEYWVEDPGLCSGCAYYKDWVDVTGRGRQYFYVWHQFYAIEVGIADAAHAAAILLSADALYARVHADYNVSAAALWCTPTNLRPTLPEDLTVDFDNEYAFGYYENGACFHWHGGLEAIARGRAQGADAAFALLEAAMTVFSPTRLLGQRYSWVSEPEAPEGSDVITDGFFLLYGGLLGSLGVRASLLGDLEVIGHAAAALEGARFTFGLLGADVTVTIENGRAQLS